MSETEVRMIEKKITVDHSLSFELQSATAQGPDKCQNLSLRMSEFIPEPPVLESVSEFPHRMSEIEDGIFGRDFLEFLDRSVSLFLSP